MSERGNGNGSSTTIHLLGGGPGAIMATRKLLKQAIKGLGKKKAVLAYVGAASNDNVGFQKMLSGFFVGTGARLEPVKLARKNASTATARRVLDACDAVFMSGGDVEHGMNILHERDMADHLRGLARAGKPFIGISAGSIMTGQAWVRFPDDDDDSKAELFPCLGVAPLHMDAHSEDDGWSELRVLVKLLAKSDADALGYGVPSRGCLQVELDGTGKPRLRALGAAVARIGARRDKAPLAP
jgi:peptidase E